MPRSQWPRISILEKSFCLSFSFSSFVYKIVVNRLQPPAKMKHGLMLAREKRVHAHSRFGGNFLEADPLEFMREENLALLFLVSHDPVCARCLVHDYGGLKVRPAPATLEDVCAVKILQGLSE